MKQKIFPAILALAFSFSIWHCAKPDHTPELPPDDDAFFAATDRDSLPPDSCSQYFVDCAGTIALTAATDSCWWLEVWAVNPCRPDTCLTGIYRSRGYCPGISLQYTVLYPGIPVYFPIKDDWIYNFRLHAGSATASVQVAVTSPYTTYNVTVNAGVVQKKMLSCDNVIKACDDKSTSK